MTLPSDEFPSVYLIKDVNRQHHAQEPARGGLLKKIPKLCPEICRKMQSIPHCMDATTSSTSATSVTCSGSANAFGQLKVGVTWGAVGFAAVTSTRRRRRGGRCGNRRCGRRRGGGGIFHASTCSPKSLTGRPRSINPWLSSRPGRYRMVCLHRTTSSSV